jgi:quercetin dioxygenase-like cupin family protein
MSTALFVAADRVEILVGAAESGGTLSLVEVWVSPGGGPPMHLHEREDETFHVLEGEITFWRGGEMHVARAGETVFGPRGIPHRFQNCADAPARMLVAMTPGGFDGYFREVGTPAEPGASPPPLTPALVERLLAPAERYGLRFVA